MAQTWKSKMEACVAGPIDYSGRELVMQCAAVADNAVTATKRQREHAAALRGKRDFTPLWSDVMSEVLYAIEEFQQNRRMDAKQIIGDMAREIVHCGEVADAWEAGVVEVTA